VAHTVVFDLYPEAEFPLMDEKHISLMIQSRSKLVPFWPDSDPEFFFLPDPDPFLLRPKHGKSRWAVKEIPDFIKSFLRCKNISNDNRSFSLSEAVLRIRDVYPGS
jgi:hypothetical protein